MASIPRPSGSEDSDGIPRPPGSDSSFGDKNSMRQSSSIDDNDSLPRPPGSDDVGTIPRNPGNDNAGRDKDGIPLPPGTVSDGNDAAQTRGRLQACEKDRVKLIDDKADLTKRLDKALRDLKVTHTALEQKTTELENTSNALISEQKAVVERQQRLDEQLALNETFRRDSHKMQNRMDGIGKDLVTAEASVRKLTTDLAMANASLVQEKEAAKNDQKQLDEQLTLNTSLQTDNAGLHATMDDMGRDIAAAQSSARKLTTDITKVNELLKQEKEAGESKQRQLDEQLAQIGILSKEKADGVKSMNELGKNLASVRASVTTLTSDLATTRASLIQEQGRSKQLEDQNVRQLAENDTRESDNQRKVLKLQEDLKQARGNVVTTTDDLAKARALLVEEQELNKQLRNQNSTQTKENSAHENENQQTIAKLQADLKQAQGNLTATTNDLAIARTTLALEQDHSKQLQAENTAQIQQNAIRETEHQGEILKLQEALREAQIRLATASNDLAEGRTRLSHATETENKLRTTIADQAAIQTTQANTITNLQKAESQLRDTIASQSSKDTTQQNTIEKLQNQVSLLEANTIQHSGLTVGFPAIRVSSSFPISFSTNGTLIASTLGTTSLKIWDVQSKSLLKDFAGPTGTEAISVVEFSPDGLYVAAGLHSGGGDGPANVGIWRVDGASYSASTKVGKRATIYKIRWKPDSKAVAFGGWNTLGVAFREGGGWNESLEVRMVVGLDVSPDGNLGLYAINDNRVVIFKFDTGEKVYSIVHSGNCSCASLGPDGLYVATGTVVQNNSSLVQIWDAKTSQLVHSFQGHTASPEYLKFSPTSPHLLVTAAREPDQQLCIWNLQTGQLEYKWNFPGIVNGLSFSSDGMWLMATSTSGWVVVFDFHTKKMQKVLRSGVGTSTSGVCAPNVQQFALSGFNNIIRVVEF